MTGPELGQHRPPANVEGRSQQWRRLHPATPLLRGGIVLLVVIGWVLSSLWNRLTGLFVPEGYNVDDPGWQLVSSSVEALLLLGGGTVLVALLVGLFSYFSWRQHRYRVGSDVLEVREGLVFRKHRQARLDRIQSIDISRPLLPRLFGLAGVDIEVAGSGGSIALRYVRSAEAELLRTGILQLASGARQQQPPLTPVQRGDDEPAAPADIPAPGLQGQPPAGHGSTRAAPRAAAGAGGASLGELIRLRLNELTDLDAATRDVRPASVVRPGFGRLLGTVLLDVVVAAVCTIAAGLVVVIALLGIASAAPPEASAEIAVIGGGILIASAVSMVFILLGTGLRRLLPNIQYSIVGTPDGVRITRGLLSTSSETLPPGRVHAVEVRQPLLWRPFGWWEVRVTRASAAEEASSGESAAQQRAVILPVGGVAEVQRVLALVAPLHAGDLMDRIVVDGMFGRGADGYRRGPARGAWLRPFSWRRTGYALELGSFFIRSGVLIRRLAIVPAERMQSVSVTQGLAGRRLRLAAVEAQTVAGVVGTRLPVIDERAAIALFDRLRGVSVLAAASDTSHRWHEAAARSTIASARLRVQDARARGLTPAAADLAVLAAEREFAAAHAGAAESGTEGERR